jgi:sugar/nucleoside kinase (ribokinase family)
VAPELSPAELEPAWFDGCDHLHVAGYSLLHDPIAGAALAAARLARAERATVSLDLSSWSRIRDLGPEVFRTRLAALAPDLVFANEPENDALGKVDGTPLVLKRGARGIVAEGREWPAAPGEAVDTTGAGDALAAGYIVGGAELGLATAARCISQLGAMP